MTTLLLALASEAPLTDQINHCIYYEDKRRAVLFKESTKFVIILPVSDFKTGKGYYSFHSQEAAIKASNRLRARRQVHQIIDKEGVNYYKYGTLRGHVRLKEIEKHELIFQKS